MITVSKTNWNFLLEIRDCVDFFFLVERVEIGVQKLLVKTEEFQWRKSWNR